MPADPPPTTPGPFVAAGPATMLELGAALGADVWWLEQIFAVAGGWVPDTPEAAVRIHLAEVSRVAGDHAVDLRRHLPRPAPVDPEAWIAPPRPEAAELVATVAGIDGSAARLGVLHRVLVTRLVVAWTAPVGGSARGAARAIGHARTDLAALRDEGEALLHALVATDLSALDAVHHTTRAVESTLAAGGGLRPPAPAEPPT